MRRSYLAVALLMLAPLFAVAQDDDLFPPGPMPIEVSETSGPLFGLEFLPDSVKVIAAVPRAARLSVRNGAIISVVAEGSRAEVSGLRPGMILSEIDGAAVRSPDDAVAGLRASTPEKPVKFIVYVKNDKERYEKKAISVTPEARKTEVADAEKGVFAKATRGGILACHVYATRLYVSVKDGRPQPKQYLSFLDVSLVSKSGAQSPTGSFFEVEGQPVKHEVSISGAGASLHRDERLGLGWILNIVGEGKPTIVASMGETKIEIPLTIEPIDVSVGMTSDQVVEAIGLPSEKKRVVVSWPESESHDGIIYSPSASSRVDIAEHWYFDKKPGLVVAIVGGKVSEIHSRPASDR